MVQGTLQPVPFVDLHLQHSKIQREIDTALKKIFQNTSFILGPEVEEFENNFAQYVGVKHCISVSSGTAALHLALLALGVGIDDEVITVPNSFFATAAAVSYCGAIPRFVDVLEETANIDCTKLESALTKRTKVVLPVHLYGQPAKLDLLREFSDKHGIKLVEDACQAHGARFAGRSVGTWGELSCFSFYPGKNLGAAGDGGAVVTDDDDLADTLRQLRNHGSRVKYHHAMVGYNMRLDTIQAAILNIKLRYLDEWNAERQECAAYYRQQLSTLPGIKMHSVEKDATHVWHLFVIQVPDRSVVESIFREHNIGFGIHYPIPIHLQPAYQAPGQTPDRFPVTEHLAQRIISLPMYAGLTREHQDRVIQALQHASKQW